MLLISDYIACVVSHVCASREIVIQWPIMPYKDVSTCSCFIFRVLWMMLNCNSCE